MSTGNAARGDLPAADVVTTTTTSASPSLTDAAPADGPALPPAPPLVPLTALTPLGGADGEAGWCVDGVCVVPPSG